MMNVDETTILTIFFLVRIIAHAIYHSQVLACLYDLPGLTQLRGRLLSEGRELMTQMAAAKKLKT